MLTMREVFSDNNFNLEIQCVRLEIQCVRCGEPVARLEDGKEVVPILTIGPLSENGALDEAAPTLCSACVSAIGFQLCYQAATRNADPQDLHCLYQVVGSPREQDQIERLIQLLDQAE